MLTNSLKSVLIIIKTNTVSGKALLERDNLDEAIKHLQRANDLAKEQKMNFGDDIAVQVLSSKCLLLLRTCVHALNFQSTNLIHSQNKKVLLKTKVTLDATCTSKRIDHLA